MFFLNFTDINYPAGSQETIAIMLITSPEKLLKNIQSAKHNCCTSLKRKANCDSLTHTNKISHQQENCISFRLKKLFRLFLFVCLKDSFPAKVLFCFFP